MKPRKIEINGGSGRTIEVASDRSETAETQPERESEAA
jgi:hypothetical protein